MRDVYLHQAIHVTNQASSFRARLSRRRFPALDTRKLHRDEAGGRGWNQQAGIWSSGPESCAHQTQ